MFDTTISTSLTSLYTHAADRQNQSHTYTWLVSNTNELIVYNVIIVGNYWREKKSLSLKQSCYIQSTSTLLKLSTKESVCVDVCCPFVHVYFSMYFKQCDITQYLLCIDKFTLPHVLPLPS